MYFVVVLFYLKGSLRRVENGNITGSEVVVLYVRQSTKRVTNATSESATQPPIDGRQSTKRVIIFSQLNYFPFTCRYKFFGSLLFND